MPTDVERVNTDRQGACICTKKKKAFFGKDPPDSSDVWFNTPADGWHLNINVLARSSCLPQDTRMERLANKCFINIFQCGRTVSAAGPGAAGAGVPPALGCSGGSAQRCINGAGTAALGRAASSPLLMRPAPLSFLPSFLAQNLQGPGLNILSDGECPAACAKIWQVSAAAPAGLPAAAHCSAHAACHPALSCRRTGRPTRH